MRTDVVSVASAHVVDAWIISISIGCGLLLAWLMPDSPLGSVPVIDWIVEPMRHLIPSINSLYEISSFPNKTARVFSVYWVAIPVQVWVFWHYRDAVFLFRRKGVRGRPSITFAGVALFTIGFAWLFVFKLGRNADGQGMLGTIDRLMSALPLALGFVGQFLFVGFAFSIAFTMALAAYLVRAARA